MKRCQYCNELNGDNRATCFKCGRSFLASSWQTSKLQSWAEHNKPASQWNDIVLRTWDEQNELRLKEHSLSVKMAGKITEVPLGQVVSVSITKEPSGKLFPGMIEIKIAGAPDTVIRLTSFISVGSGNSISFPHGIKYKQEAHRLKEYIIKYQSKSEPLPQVPTQSVTSSTSAADEIRKYKELLDIGAITQDEFNAKKKQLLGL